ncbi:unnamed protein product, partial [Hapterophycus canaliculatus]
MAGVQDDTASRDDGEDDLIYRKTANHLQQYWTESKSDVNVKRTMEPHNALLRAVRHRLAVDSSTREAAQKDGDDRPATFGVTKSGHTVLFLNVAPAQTTRAGPEPCAFARQGFIASEDRSPQPALDSR